MNSKQLTEVIPGKKKNFVLIGEAGSGKTELAINLANFLAHSDMREVHLFDMDQTKAVLRARDSFDKLKENGVILHFEEQLMDTPQLASGVNEALQNPKFTVLMDVGGGSHGSHMIGQFEEYINSEDTEVLYIINPNRPWSTNRADIEETMARVLGAAGISSISIVANPNIGLKTTIDTVTEGIERIRAMFPESEISFVVVSEELKEEATGKIDLPVFSISLSTMPKWFKKEI